MERAAGVGHGAVVPDVRGEDRALRTTWHHEVGVVVLSVWRENVCVATVRLAPDDARALVEVLAAGCEDAHGPVTDGIASG